MNSRIIKTLWFLQLCSLSGIQVIQFIIPVWVFQTTENINFLGFLYTASFLPKVVLSPFGGYLIDKFDRRKIVICCSATQAFLALFVAALTSFTLPDLRHIIVLCVIEMAMSFLHSIQVISIHTFLPQFTNKNDLTRANAQFQFADSFSLLFAPAMAGTILSLWGVSYPALVTAMIFIFAAFLFAMTKIEDVVAKSTTNLKNGIFEGYKFIYQSKGWFELLCITSFVNFLFSMSIVAFMPLALFYTNNNSLMLGQIYAAGGAGQICGALLMTFIGKNISNPLGLLLNTIILLGFVGPMVIGFSSSFLGFAVGMFCMYLCLTTINVLNNSIWLALVPQEFQGRVIATRRSLAASLAPIATLLSGPIISHFFLPFTQNETIAFGRLFVFVGIGIVIIGLISLKIPNLNFLRGEFSNKYQMDPSFQKTFE
jgi:DHA3 family macrolide efflux protein-like MFS transporter